MTEKVTKIKPEKDEQDRDESHVRVFMTTRRGLRTKDVLASAVISLGWSLILVWLRERIILTEKGIELYFGGWLSRKRRDVNLNMEEISAVTKEDSLGQVLIGETTLIVTTSSGKEERFRCAAASLMMLLFNDVQGDKRIDSRQLKFFLTIFKVRERLTVWFVWAAFLVLWLVFPFLVWREGFTQAFLHLAAIETFIWIFLLMIFPPLG